MSTLQIIALILGPLLTLVLLAVWWRWFKRHREVLWRWTTERWRRLPQIALLRQLRRRYPRLWGFVLGRFDRQAYLGLHLTIGLGISLLALKGFGELAGAIAEQKELHSLDLRISQEVHAATTPLGINLFKSISLLGSVAALTLLSLLVGIVLLVRGRYLFLAGWLVAVAGGGLLNTGLKFFYQRPRPSFEEPIISLTSWSFPSGHAMGSLVSYSMLGYLLARLGGRWRSRRLIMAAMATLVLAIGVSRIYLGAHYFSDVLAGYSAGLIWLACCISGLEVARRHPRSQAERRAAGKPEGGTREVPLTREPRSCWKPEAEAKAEAAREQPQPAALPNQQPAPLRERAAGGPYGTER